MKRILLLIICLIYTVGSTFAITFPTFLHSSIWENWIHPTWNFTLDITYEDVWWWIDLTTDDLKLYKYNWTTWWANIAPTYINFWTKSIWKNHAVFSVVGLDLWKYKYVFSIDNLSGHTNTKEVVFYVDRPEFNINTGIQDIWLLTDNLKFLSPERLVTVRTIGAPYTVTMTKIQGLNYLTESILPWNWTKWWWYTRDPYNSNVQAQALSALNTVILNSGPLNPNTSWILNNDILRFKVWAKEEIDTIGWKYEAELKFDINFTYCPEYNGNNTCKTYWKFIKNLNWAKKWEDGTIAKSCYYYKYPESSWYEYLWEIGDWEYWIKPDAAQPAFKAYCDMTSNWWGWTRYVNIKANYTLGDAKSCWLGTNISNASLECFNPNRYGVNSAQLFNNEWNNTKYYYDISDSKPSTTTSNIRGPRYCKGHDEYMTIMRKDQDPLADASDSTFVRMWRDFCKYWRDPAGTSWWTSYMNYDPGASFWEGVWWGRQANAKFTKLYFREVDLWFTQVNKTIVNYSWAKRWSDETYAKSCNEYKNPPSWYTYAWDIWNWEYWIDSDWIGWYPEFKVVCDMTTDSWGWTQIRNWVSWSPTVNVSWLVVWGEEILMTYKRLDNASKKYAIRIDQFKVKHCWEEYTTAAAYSNHLQTWSWWTCARKATTWDYNDIKTTEIIAAPFVEDACVTWNNHKNTSRNTQWGTSWWKWRIMFRVTNHTVLMWPEWDWSVRCASSVQNWRRQTEVQTWVR